MKPHGEGAYRPYDHGGAVVEERFAADDHRERGRGPQLIEQRDDSDGVGGGHDGAEREAEVPRPIIRQHGLGDHREDRGAKEHARDGQQRALSKALGECVPAEEHRVTEDERRQERVEEQVPVHVLPCLDRLGNMLVCRGSVVDDFHQDANYQEEGCVRHPRRDLAQQPLRDHAQNDAHRGEDDGGLEPGVVPPVPRGGTAGARVSATPLGSSVVGNGRRGAGDIVGRGARARLACPDAREHPKKRERQRHTANTEGHHAR